jgi:hypothetical protein
MQDELQHLHDRMTRWVSEDHPRIPGWKPHLQKAVTMGQYFALGPHSRHIVVSDLSANDVKTSQFFLNNVVFNTTTGKFRVTNHCPCGTELKKHSPESISKSKHTYIVVLNAKTVAAIQNSNVATGPRPDDGDEYVCAHQQCHELWLASRFAALACNQTDWLKLTQNNVKKKKKSKKKPKKKPKAKTPKGR